MLDSNLFESHGNKKQFSKLSERRYLSADLHASSPAVGTFLDSARLASDPLAAVADDVLLERELANRPVVHVFQGDGELVHQVLRSARPTLPAETRPWKRAIVNYFEKTSER